MSLFTLDHEDQSPGSFKYSEEDLQVAVTKAKNELKKNLKSAMLEYLRDSDFDNVDSSSLQEFIAWFCDTH